MRRCQRSWARDAGCKVISTKWLDINKGDAEHRNYRARLVGRELKLDNRLDLFAAMPPLEALRIMCSICASHQRRRNPYRMLRIDVKRAYFHAKAQRPVFIEIPTEDWSLVTSTAWATSISACMALATPHKTGLPS